MKFIYLLLCTFFVFSLHAETMQKRLYKKRHNKVQINAGSLRFSPEYDIIANIAVSYSRNFGHFEVGALLELSNAQINIYQIGETEMENLGFRAGLVAEGNFIKNKRRNNWIPSGGLKLVYMFSPYKFNESQKRDAGFYANPFLSSKHFISSRTSINIELEYPLKVYEWSTDDLWKGLDFSFAYAYYFH